MKRVGYQTRGSQPDHQTWSDYFDPDEKLIWEGTPVSGWPSLGGIFLSVFGMPFLGAGLFTTITALRGDAAPTEGGGTMEGITLFLFGLPFLLVGLGLVLGPWLGAFYAPRYMRYALTNKKAYIAKSFLRRSLEVYDITPSNVVEYEEGRTGSVFFHVQSRVDSDGDRIDRRIGFENIRDSRSVYDLIRKSQRDARA
ncbi:MAG: hypothetical protein AAGJ34_05610 [Pseudomonadota bacterium]